MLKNRVNGHGKRAGVTVEVILAALLTVIVLFLVLGLFSDNLKNMIKGSNISNLWDNSNKTTFSTLANDPTKSQVNIQITGEQGLDYYKEEAPKKINYYKNNPPQNEAEVFDLAKWATIAKIITTTGSNGLNSQLLSGSDEGLFSQRNGIDISLDNTASFNTTISVDNRIIKTLNFSIATGNQRRNTTSMNNTEQLSAIRAVLSNNFN